MLWESNRNVPGPCGALRKHVHNGERRKPTLGAVVPLGPQFVIVTLATEQGTQALTLAVNWPALLKKQPQPRRSEGLQQRVGESD